MATGNRDRRRLSSIVSKLNPKVFSNINYYDIKPIAKCDSQLFEDEKKISQDLAAISSKISVTNGS